MKFNPYAYGPKGMTSCPFSAQDAPRLAAGRLHQRMTLGSRLKLTSSNTEAPILQSKFLSALEFRMSYPGLLTNMDSPCQRAWAFP